ncbi:MAG TPA: NADH-ubiquinone oxidoreductase-F iron-sulfur binding region domain-containing protein [Candidatus Limnocylindria bacterium]|nr:NADH-ubiquinone oxidoreductase-F iron-sulfur binding region domain-containing protein [Candidatus Limnocylindria bacterium]
MASTISPHIRILPGGEHRLLTEIGRIDPESIASFREVGGYGGLERAVTRLSPEEVIVEIEGAGLRGRGGSGFPTAAKWRIARDTPADRKIVVANLMGADPSALGDRALAEGNPHLVIEGLLIAAYAAGAGEAIVAVRRDWTDAIARLRTAAAEATDAHLAGYLVLGTDTSIQLSVWEGSGAYVAGEETALISALAGDRGMPLIRPPFPATRGLHGVPTLVQNGETLAHVAWILSHSSEAFASAGSDASRGTKLVTIMGKVNQPGLVEVPLGATIGAIIDLAGGPSGSPKAAFVGGPGGGALAEAEFTTPYDYEPLGSAGALIGSGALLVVDGSTCMVDSARFFADFSAREACGKAVPCRIGTRRLVEGLDRILAATPRPNDITMLRELSRKISDTALCRLERIAPGPILTTLDRFTDEYRAHAERGECPAGACRAPGGAPLLQPLAGLE